MLKPRRRKEGEIHREEGGRGSWRRGVGSRRAGRAQCHERFAMHARDGLSMEAGLQLPLGRSLLSHAGFFLEGGSCGAKARQGSSCLAMWHCCYCWTEFLPYDTSVFSIKQKLQLLGFFLPWIWRKSGKRNFFPPPPHFTMNYLWGCFVKEELRARNKRQIWSLPSDGYSKRTHHFIMGRSPLVLIAVFNWLCVALCFKVLVWAWWSVSCRSNSAS